MTPPIRVTVREGTIQDISDIPAGTEIEVRDYDLDSLRAACPDCGGSGGTDFDPCQHCAGTGDDPDEYNHDEEGNECTISLWISTEED